MNVRLVNEAAELICRAMETHQTAAGIAMALDASGMLQPPETAAELKRLRGQVVTQVSLLKRAQAEARTALNTGGDPWQRATDGLNALVDAGIGFHIEPDGHIAGPDGEHIEWDRDAERWTLTHDEDAPGPTVAESVARLRSVLAPSTVSRTPEPYACAVCGIPRRPHMQQWKLPAGWHKWKAPTDEQIKARMQALRAERLAARGDRP
ncbi:hypothetical protein FCH28_09565 [Streptomyces piniterrae]|uniref:Uncharacterized protein n=1 Tax=Streptomyces piniterrae TaxID=2571125 RepID=A0A4U0NME4_9ACTN|nr:hypothetical protein [Streptomyces piniterrae]TJZ55579.1 hypothetical protein FCH28_09565 [Streptomyces piniterrae]